MLDVIKLIESRNSWNAFLRQIQPNTFLQSWEWGEFQRATGEKIWRLGIYDNPDALCAAALIIKVRARRGAFLFCPHGPIFSCNMKHVTCNIVLEKFVGYLKELAKKEGCSFIRFSPLMLKTVEHEKLWHGIGFREAPIHMHPELAWILDITPSEDELLKGMRKTTRYAIRKAEKDGVTVTKCTNPGDIDKFWAVYRTTVSRQHFVPFSKTYLRKEFETFSAEDRAVLFFGTYRGEVIASAFVVFTPWSAFYHHGASTPKYTNIPASQLVQWHAILEAKRRGCVKYNFWGIAPEGAKNHPWAGLTTFKRGFGGFAEQYVHAKDFALTRKYWLAYLVEKARKIKRGL